jgi:hypothetical protein
VDAALTNAQSLDSYQQGIIDVAWVFVNEVVDAIVNGTLDITGELIDTAYELLQLVISLETSSVDLLVNTLIWIIEVITGQKPTIDDGNVISPTTPTPATRTYPPMRYNKNVCPTTVPCVCPTSPVTEAPTDTTTTRSPVGTYPPRR